MATAVVGSNPPIVQELLAPDNYIQWHDLMKDYLIAQDLYWDIIEEDHDNIDKADDKGTCSTGDSASDEYKVRRRKNATARHSIKMSCGAEALSFIMGIDSAKIAWNTLATKYTTKVEPEITTSNYSENKNYIQQYAPLLKAVQSGNWEAAKAFLSAHPEAMRVGITYIGRTALHVAVEFRHLHIVEELVKLMSAQDLEIKDSAGRTALAFAALIGNSQIAEAEWMVITLDYNQMIKGLVYDAIFRAAERGISEFIIEILKENPDLVWCDMFRGFLFSAIRFRQAKIFSLIYGLGLNDEAKRSADANCNNMLHIAGMLAPFTQLNHAAGAALQMQRELQWYKEVEYIAPSMMKESLNMDNMRPQDLFTANHKELLKGGEKWMKETAKSCTVVGSLIFSIMFSAAFTVPGGNNENTGHPILLNHKLFMLFILSDTISLFSSSTSVLMFMGILTSRYAEEDFLKSLPTKLIIGLSSLFISIATMMIAFCASLFIVLQNRSWIVIPAILLACIPVTSFIWIQFPPFVQLCISTYGSCIFDRKVKRWF
ncbi:Ankyrin repeat family protein [Quillaja saponaria]|uniref:Ankyrin repeat family protein n=1 Tax=Quillaja saponaria TaxID=32244 RepID=A0AAD7PZH7_QUISA|nr:Ankyrin repeat family protein [Quillaja saponaria]